MIARSVVWMLAATALCACGGTGRLAPDTPPGVTLAGTWKLNRQASQDPNAMLERIRQDLVKQMSSHRGMYDDDELPPVEGSPDQPGSQTGGHRSRGVGQHGGGDNGPGSHGGPDRFMQRFSYAQSLGPQLTSDELTIEQSPNRLVLIRGEWRRSFTPGAESVVSVPNGVADQHSGWKGREYVIEVRPPRDVGPRVIERYGLSADNRQLVEKITLTEDGLPKLEFTRVYDPGTRTQRALPTSN